MASKHWHAFLWRQGHLIDLGALIGSDSEAFGINANGQIVGTCGTLFVMETKEKSRHATIWENNHTEDLNDCIPPDSGWHLETATAINDRGQIVGSGYIHGEKHAFLLSPLRP